MHRKIILVGPMGAGKTSLGRRLAHKLRWRFYDTDHEIISRTGVDIPHIFEQEGEEGFRKREHFALQNILQTPEDAVVACGGGIVIKAENRELIMGQSLVVFLDVSVERQLQRIGHDSNRPLAQAPDQCARLQALRDNRLGLYEGIADIRLDTDDNHFSSSFRHLLTSVRQYIDTYQMTSRD